MNITEFQEAMDSLGIPHKDGLVEVPHTCSHSYTQTLGTIALANQEFFTRMADEYGTELLNGNIVHYYETATPEQRQAVAEVCEFLEVHYPLMDDLIHSEIESQEIIAYLDTYNDSEHAAEDIYWQMLTNGAEFLEESNLSFYYNESEFDEAIEELNEKLS